MRGFTTYYFFGQCSSDFDPNEFLYGNGTGIGLVSYNCTWCYGDGATSGYGDGNGKGDASTDYKSEMLMFCDNYDV